MSGSSHGQQGPRLFDDLPLRTDPAAEKPAPGARSPARKDRAQPQDQAPAKPLPLFSAAGEPQRTEKDPPPRSASKVSPSSTEAVTRPIWKPGLPALARQVAGCIDFAVLLAVLVLARLGLWSLGITLEGKDALPIAAFLLTFSFLYHVFPLAFWGRTPGMARVGIVVRNLDGRSLTFAQTAVRWLSAVLTAATLGLPWILPAFRNISLADQLSRSRTLLAG